MQGGPVELRALERLRRLRETTKRAASAKQGGDKFVGGGLQTDFTVVFCSRQADASPLTPSDSRLSSEELGGGGALSLTLTLTP